MSRITEDGHHGRGPRHDIVPPRGIAFRAGRFGRMVPELANPLETPDKALVDLGLSMRDGGPGGKESGDNENIPAGFTYLGQFIDHDITLDTTNLSEVSQDPAAVENFRTPRLDLDSVYGFGPRAQPSLYDRTSKGRAKLLVGPTTAAGPIKAGLLHDLPRNAQGFAIIGDERNDENLLVAQTHVSFLRFHNAIVDKLAGTVPDNALFTRARRAAVDLYQSMVVRDFLTKICDPNDVAAAVERRRFFRFEHFGAFHQPYMPVEFSVAAYRLGHSMVRDNYSHNRIFRPGNPPLPSGTLRLLFAFTAKSGDIGTEGGGPSNAPTLPSNWIVDWRRFLDFGTDDTSDGFTLNLTRNIDPYLAPELHQLPGTSGEPGDRSLAVMNLRRGVKMKLPSAQSLARFMGVKPLSPDEIAASGPDGVEAKKHGLHVRTPLWYYILKEAELRGKGKRLGPLGSLIVAETFIGLLQGDPESILARDPSWRLGDPVQNLVLDGADKSFTFADLVAVGAGGRTKEKLSPVDDPANSQPAPANQEPVPANEAQAAPATAAE